MGFDCWSSEQFTAVNLTKLNRYNRRILGQINLEAAEKIAYKNVDYLLTLRRTPVYVEPSSNCGSKTPCFSRMQNAIDSTGSNLLIKASGGTYVEDVTFAQGHNVTISGGWNSTFTTQSSNTVFISLTINGTSGTVEIDKIVLQ